MAGERTWSPRHGSAIPAGRLAELEKLQRELAQRVIECPLASPPRTVAGADVHVRGEQAIGVVVLFAILKTPRDENDIRPLELREIDRVVVQQRVTFPYIPGFLSFREAPVVLEAVTRLSSRPDLLIVDGQGQAHPRRCGIASHLGVTLDLPTIGAAKSRLYGHYREPANVRGAWSPLLADGTVIGAAVRTRVGAKPIFVSVGHRITLAEAILWVLRLSRYRIPEPTRWAHRYAQELVRSLPSPDGETSR